MPMKLKLDDKGHVVTVGEGDAKQPVYVYDDGKEVPFDVPGTVARISALNNEAKTHRESKEQMEAKIRAYIDAGVDDPIAASEALKTVANYKDKQLVDAGKVEEVRAAATRAMDERMQQQAQAHAQKLNELTSELNNSRAMLSNEIIGGSFARSKYIGEKCVAPPDMLQAKFGSQFKIENGKLVAYDAEGTRLYSRVRPGDSNVDFEEAIEIILDSYPNKAAILKGSGSQGSGSTQSNLGAGGKKRITRSAFESLSPEVRQATLKDHELVD